MQVSIIAAIGENNELGANNDLLWHLPVDFKWFIQNTKGKPVLMGRKTMESLGKPLKNRMNIVLSRSAKNLEDGFYLSHTLDEAFQLVESADNKELMIIGGAQIYEQTLALCDRLILTHVQAKFENADTFFPKLDMSQWNCVFVEEHFADDQHAFDYKFCIYEKNTKD